MYFSNLSKKGSVAFKPNEFKILFVTSLKIPPYPWCENTKSTWHFKRFLTQGEIS